MRNEDRRARSEGALATRPFPVASGGIPAAIGPGAAHDLRSALGAISNFASLLEEDHRGGLDEEAREIVARIRRAAATAFTVLDGIARLARAEGGDLCIERVDVEDLVREVFAELHAERARVELVVAELPVAAADARL